jgi:protein-S-isoprenylcysteine O-methyltransferase Ste14
MGAFFHAVPVFGLVPPLYALVGLIGVFLVLKGRTRDATPGTRERKSLLGIMLQAAGFGLVSAGRVDLTGRLSELDVIGYGAAALAAGVGAILLFASARRAMGANWSIVARTREDHQLVTSGPFARLRHPIYAAMGLFLIGLANALGHLDALLLAVPISLAGTMVRVKIEEKLLAAQFGQQFDAYRKSVPALLPRF